MRTLLLLAALTAPACGSTLYENGPVNGTVESWAINFGFVISNDFHLAADSTVTGFGFGSWSFAGDSPETVDWSFTSSPNGGRVFASGTASLSNTLLFRNAQGYDVREELAPGKSVGLGAGMYWFNLQNATTALGKPLYWDENQGIGCVSPGCPSVAFDNAKGTIPPESFALFGEARTVPEPGTPGLVALGAALVVWGERRAGRSRLLDDR